MLHLLKRETHLAWAEGLSSIRSILFFIVISGVLPIAISVMPEILRSIAGGMMWILVLLSALLSIERMFQADIEDGTLTALLGYISGSSITRRLWSIVTAKCCVLWAVTCLPIVIIIPLVGQWYQLEMTELMVASGALLIGTPGVVAIGAVGAALLAGVPRSGALLIIITVPFYIPVLIFGSSIIQASVLGVDYWPLVKILGGLSLLYTSLGSIVTTLTLRIHLE